MNLNQSLDRLYEDAVKARLGSPIDKSNVAGFKHREKQSRKGGQSEPLSMIRSLEEGSD
jgi:hypothetical protein